MNYSSADLLRTPLLPFEREALRCLADAIEAWLFEQRRYERRFNVELLRRTRE